MRDNDLCREAKSVWLFEGEGPRRTAGCKPNEVDVPLVADAEPRRSQDVALFAILIENQCDARGTIRIVLDGRDADRLPGEGLPDEWQDGHFTASVRYEEKEQVGQLLALELRRIRAEVGDASYKSSAKSLKVNR